MKLLMSYVMADQHHLSTSKYLEENVALKEMKKT